ncbi:hypothetical protein FOS14_11300 [Skermania sp. ID1734]|uniref:hypothetical protein n=1 Tax=Skermania sp. ID1734 TaxID=2597516 RepID=UPI00117E1901|nr:hypothetical protein [Skermania sp. ID1734]TSD99821.1 hypothetical protein FOS14_11300 [Skermania sp. ID1734]
MTDATQTTVRDSLSDAARDMGALVDALGERIQPGAEFAVTTVGNFAAAVESARNAGSELRRAVTILVNNDQQRATDSVEIGVVEPDASDGEMSVAESWSTAVHDVGALADALGDDVRPAFTLAVDAASTVVTSIDSARSAGSGAWNTIRKLA